MANRLLIVVMSLAFAPAEATAAKLVCQESWRCVFAESTVEYHIEVHGAAAPPHAIYWSLIVADRPVASGEAPVEEAAAVVKLTLPPVKPSVVLDAHLRLSAQAAQGADGELTLEVPLAIYPRNAFPLDQIRSFKIAIFDPAKTTAKVLNEAGLSLHEVRTAESLRTTTAEFVVIGEGVPADRHANLPQLMFDLIAAGKNVFCLAPGTGRWRLPALSGEEPTTQSVALRRGDALQELDKRFDTASWPGVSQPITGGLLLEAYQGRLGARLIPGEGTWPWVEVHSPAGGQGVFCGYGLIKYWDESPVPRYVIASLLQQALRRRSDVEEK